MSTLQLSTESSGASRSQQSPGTVVPLDITLAEAELFESNSRAVAQGVSLQHWLLATALNEAWRVVHEVERHWPCGFPGSLHEGRRTTVLLSLEAVDALAEALTGVFFWVDEEPREISLVAFIEGAVRRRVCTDEVAR